MEKEPLFDLFQLPNPIENILEGRKEGQGRGSIDKPDEDFSRQPDEHPDDDRHLKECRGFAGYSRAHRDMTDNALNDKRPTDKHDVPAYDEQDEPHG